MENLSRILGSISSKIFFPAIVVLAIIKLAEWTGPQFILGICIVLVYLSWIVIEPLLTGRDANTGDPAEDKGTFEMYYIAKSTTVIVSLAFPTLGYDNMLHFYIGMGLFVSGLLLRVYAIHTLGVFYSHFVEHKTNHQVIAQGPYHMIRHPSYAGMLTAHVGFVCFFFNWLSLVMLLILFIPAVIRRIRVEEKMLLRQVDHYDEYAAQRKRLIPFVW